MTTTPNNTESTLASFIWKNADDLWGDFPHTEFGKIILPLTVLRRLECVLEPTKQAVIDANEQFKDKGMAMDDILKNVSGNPFYNTSNYNLSNLGGTKTKANLEDYIANFSDNVRVIFEQFDFSSTINKLAKANLLLRICNNFSAIDLHPSVVPDRTMSNVYEHLIARFGAEVGTGSEDFMTPRDIVHLAATLLLEPDNELFEQKQGLIRTIYDQTCGTSGFLTDMMNYVEGYKDRYNVAPVLVPYGQELQPETHAVALGSMLLKKLESDPSRDLSQNIKLGSTLSQDHYSGQHFHYQCSNPPFGMSWAKDAAKVQQEYSEKGFTGRFGAGLPKASDGSMLFLQNLISKLEKPENGGGRGAIVLSGSPLFNGGAGSGESEIRRFILESDYLEAIVALPTDIFFRTGIGTYIWLISNRKPEHRKGKVQLIDATGMGASMRKNEGNKRKFVDQNSIDEITRIYADFQESPISKIFDYTDFGYRRVKVLRPLRIDLVFDAEKLNTFKDSKEFGKLAESDQNAVSSYIEKQFGESKDYTWFETSFLKNLPLSKVSKALKNALISAFGVQNPDADTVTINGDVQMDSDLTDYENIPLKQDIQAYMEKEVLPHAPDAVIDTSYTDSKDNQVGVVGYEINFNRYFYVFEQPRHPNEIMAEIKELSAEVAQLLGGI
ncbi:type I restriction-modification system subunit M [Escherichia coli]|uniref:site-specific DNA-methyltransferase (adenine-specific) n=1 Tax=Tenebrionibacter intestinalis TaxID=2799638 RepID=A0A8K0V339_9ENTR|nr:MULTISPECIES: class I SAM-dependent DNA methyltransferase [Enterobacteriaceae]HDL8130239.1 SAM-dependent DNA methyltransferase [Yersinia enterocolitica]MBK4715946.1 SAM-dependent DNA methyltransferase [Tenebrionibacter intestinalis]MCR1319141.1 type I restriction-modification system subunit M [Enterobacter soli]MCZ9399646.1 type I restriction-modification system subunit M [Escherichia coli]MDX7659833.1 class I SAM-dependent DNA methyltransferase [Klebsiella quasipneumoniae]